MKHLFSFLFLLGCMAMYGQNTIAGDWKGTRDSPNGTFELNYTFVVEGDKLTGALKTQFGDTPLENGKVDGKTFSYSITFGEMTIENKGEVVSADELVIKSERGDMTLTRVKP